MNEWWCRVAIPRENGLIIGYTDRARQLNGGGAHAAGGTQSPPPGASRQYESVH